MYRTRRENFSLLRTTGSDECLAVLSVFFTNNGLCAVRSHVKTGRMSSGKKARGQPFGSELRFESFSAAFFYPGGSITVSHRIDALGVFGKVLSVQAPDKHSIFKRRPWTVALVFILCF